MSGGNLNSLISIENNFLSDEAESNNNQNEEMNQYAEKDSLNSDSRESQE